MLLSFTTMIAEAAVSSGAVSDSQWLIALFLALVSLAAGGYAAFLHWKRRDWKDRYRGHIADKEAKINALTAERDSARDDSQRHQSSGADAEQRIQECKAEIQRIRQHHPAFQRIIYNIGVVGISASGKTALVTKMVNPGFRDIKGLGQSPRQEIHDRTAIVTHRVKEHKRIEHVFRFHVWAGEAKVAAQTEMLNICRPEYYEEKPEVVRRAYLQALILVVDVAQPEQPSQDLYGAPSLHEFSKERIDDQINRYFSEDAVEFFLNDQVRPKLHVIVLFINKFDRALHLGSNYESAQNVLLEEYFSGLIKTLRKHAGRVPVEVVVGSAHTDAGLHEIFCQLAVRILEKDLREAEPSSPTGKGAATVPIQQQQQPVDVQIPVAAAAGG